MKRECDACRCDFYVPAQSKWDMCPDCRIEFYAQREIDRRDKEFRVYVLNGIYALPTWDGPVIGEDDAP